MTAQKEYWSKGQAIACLLWLALCGTVFSNAGLYLLHVLAVAIFAVVWALSWLARLAFYFWKKRVRLTSQSEFVERHTGYWVVEPSVALLVLALAWLGIFSFLRFSISESALTRYVGDVRAGSVDIAFEFAHPPRRVGLYVVTMTDLSPEGTVRVTTSKDRVWDSAGFAHSVKGEPPHRGEDSYRHLSGGWWKYSQSW